MEHRPDNPSDLQYFAARVAGMCAPLKSKSFYRHLQTEKPVIAVRFYLLSAKPFWSADVYPQITPKFGKMTHFCQRYHSLEARLGRK